jgi:hypothetical protein
MKVWGSGAGLVCAALALLAVPAAAVASPGYEVQNKSLRLELKTAGSNGYSVSIATVGHKQVKLTASKHGVFAAYTVDGRVSRHGIDADFGQLGHLSVRFRGVSRPFELIPGLPLHLHPSRRDCRGRPPRREVGRFRGEIEFEGEHGFTAVDARTARGEVDRSYRRVCKRRSPKATAAKREGNTGKAGFDLTLLSASERSPDRRVIFGAIGFEAFGPKPTDDKASPGVILIAGVDERPGRVAITRAALIDGEPGGILLSKRGAVPVKATVAPPSPFSGTASYLDQPGATPSWSGDLSVRLPGVGAVPLTGPGFSADFCRLHSPKHLKGCGAGIKGGLSRPAPARLLRAAAPTPRP